MSDQNSETKKSYHLESVDMWYHESPEGSRLHITVPSNTPLEGYSINLDTSWEDVVDQLKWAAKEGGRESERG